MICLRQAGWAPGTHHRFTGCELAALTIKGLVFSGDLRVLLFSDPNFVPKTVFLLSGWALVVLGALCPAPVVWTVKRLCLLRPMGLRAFTSSELG